MTTIYFYRLGKNIAYNFVRDMRAYRVNERRAEVKIVTLIHVHLPRAGIFNVYRSARNSPLVGSVP